MLSWAILDYLGPSVPGHQHIFICLIPKGSFFASSRGAIWPVGFYKINPSTKSGQKMFIFHMLILPLIPITALVIQNAVAMNIYSSYQTEVVDSRSQVNQS